MAALIDAIEVKPKMFFEVENTPFLCLEAEISTLTARVCPDLGPPEDAEPSHTRGLWQNIQGQWQVQGAGPPDGPGILPVQGLPYIVFDPTDSLSAATQNRWHGKLIGYHATWTTYANRKAAGTL
jgi:hypothetical protein